MLLYKYNKRNTRITISILILISLTFSSFNFVFTNQIPFNIDTKQKLNQKSALDDLNNSYLYDKTDSLESKDLNLRNEEKEDNIITKPPIQNEDGDSLPKIKIVKEDEQGLIISFALSDVNVENINTSSDEIYQKIDIIGGGHLAEIGKPELPTKGVYLDVPRSVELNVEVKYSRYFEEFGYNVYPAQKEVPEIDDSKKDIEKSTTFYEADNFYPNNLVEIKEIGIIRNHRTVLLVFYPVSYNPVSKTIRVYCKLDIEIRYTKNDKGTSSNTQNLRDSSRYYSNEFSSFFESIYLNYDSSVEEKLLSETSQIEADGADYLIITPDEFYDEMIPLAQHKTNKGLLTEIVNLSEIGVNPSADDISAYIQNAYDSWNPAPTYLLLVGDSNLLPPHYKTTHPYHGTLNPTDIYYATVDGTDYFPDIFLGRLPVKTETELNIVVNKIINYEENFDQSDPWRKNVTIAAYEQSGRYFIATSENISSFLETKDYNINKIYTGGSYTGTTQDVIDAINNGTFLVNHRDHGEWYGWGDPSFTVYDIDELNNGEMLPAMFSINCLSGRFDYSSDCFAEAILKAENKGVVGIIGSTRVSYSGYNDELDKGFIASIWPEYQSSYDNSVGKSAKLGHILNFGKMYMYDKYVLTNGAGYPWGSDDFESKITFEMFTLFGDPELSIFQVDHDLQVSLEIPANPNISNTYTINATIKNTGFKIETNIDFYLYYENLEVQNINIPTLSPGESVTIDYEWTSNTYGSFNFTAYTLPKPGEFYLSNNRVTKFAQIRRDLIVNIDVPLKVYINKSYLIKATIKNNGITPENDVELYLRLNKDLKNFTLIDTLNIEESYTISYNWTPGEYGIYNITSDTPLRQGELDIANNVNHLNITVNPTIFYDGFENGRLNLKNVEGLWHFTSVESPWPDPCHSGSHAMWFGRESTGTFDRVYYREYGSIITIPINLSDVSSAYLSFYQWMEGEQLYPYDCGYVFISINGTNWNQLYRNGINIETWEYTVFNISKYCGNETVYIRFFFDSIDSLFNNYRGWLIDDVEIYTNDYNYKEKNFECPSIPPSLIDEKVTPKIGYQDTQFSFIVNYTDINNDAPVQINAIINGTAYAMPKQDSLDYDYTDGCIYNYSTQLALVPYNYTYYFNCSDGIYFCTTNVYNDLQIHLKPTLTNESVTPKIGYYDTVITFKVNYTHLDNTTPLRISVIINSYSYLMSKQDSSDQDYRDGCIYVYSNTLSPQSNNYTYYFYCSDNDGVNFVSTTKYNDLKIHSKPVLIDEYFYPNIGGYSDTYFRFRVTYQDADNNAPTQINLIINGTPHVMYKYYTYDNNYADGCLYYYNTYLPAAPYNYVYYFNCSDGIHIITTSKNSFRVHNRPTLINGSATPKIGFENTLITFRVNYTDIDNDAPKYISVVINYYIYAMIKQDNLDNNYTNGCTYIYSTYLSPLSYNYSYYFCCTDDGFNYLYSVYYEDLKISNSQDPAIIDNGDDDDDDKKSKSNERNDLLVPIIFVVSSISGISGLGIALFYMKKKNIMLFKSREKTVS